MEVSHVEGRVDKSIRGNIRYLCLCLFMGITIMESGLDASSVGGFQAMVGFLEVFGYRDPTSSSGWNIGTVPQQIIGSFMTLGSAVGALLLGPMSSVLPRTWSIGVGCILLLIATVIQAVTTSLGALYFARILVGMGNGIIQAYCIIYIQETAPYHLRALSSGILQSFLSVGTLVGTVIDNATADIAGRLCYQIPLFVLIAIPLVFLISIPFLPESPRWLLQHQKEDKALRCLTRLRRGPSDEIAIAAEFEKMKFWELRELEDISTISIVEIFRGTNLRRTLLACGVAVAPSGVGAMFVLTYSTYFFQMAGLANAFEDSVIVQCIGLAGTYISFFLIRRLGTKSMLIFSGSLCCVCMLMLGIINSATGGSDSGLRGVVAMVAMYMFGFNSGIAIYAYPTAAELPSQRLRAYTTGFAVAVAFFFSWVTTFTAPYFINSENLNWGPKYGKYIPALIDQVSTNSLIGYVWFGSSFVVVIFLIFFLPDCNGRSLDDIDSLFESRVPARQFPNYICTVAGLVHKSKQAEVEAPMADHLETAM